MKLIGLIVGLFALAIAYRYFTRAHRITPGAKHQPARQRAAMSRQEACAVLGITYPASQQAVVEAHRRLMQKLHPDKGGSAHLAQQLNEAKRILLSNDP